MNIVVRILILISASLLGITLLALTVNLLIYSGVFPDTQSNPVFSHNVLNMATYILIGSVFVGIGSIFVQHKGVRWALALMPLLMPSIFTVIYTLIQ